MVFIIKFNFYLMSNFVLVSKEIIINNLEIKGELFRDLLGMYFRNGLNF